MFPCLLRILLPHIERVLERLVLGRELVDHFMPGDARHQVEFGIRLIECLLDAPALQVLLGKPAVGLLEIGDRLLQLFIQGR
jgi:hypothetical protein